MKRDKTIQVPVTEQELERVKLCAEAAGVSVASWMRSECLGLGLLLAQGILCENQEAARWANPDGRFPLLLLRLLSGSDTAVFAVLDEEERPVAVRLYPSSRFAIRGSPWPYRIVEDYSSQGPGVVGHRTVLRLAVCHDERAFMDRKEAHAEAN